MHTEKLTRVDTSGLIPNSGVGLRSWKKSNEALYFDNFLTGFGATSLEVERRPWSFCFKLRMGSLADRNTSGSPMFFCVLSKDLHVQVAIEFLASTLEWTTLIQDLDRDYGIE
jgi:hypothetical protein